MKSRFIAFAVVVVALGTAGRLGRIWIAPVRVEVRLRQQVWGAEAAGGVPAQGLRLGWPAGFRALAADFLWLRVNLSWEKRDLAGTLQNLRLVAALDPRPLGFWLNGARMLAYDMPKWRMEVLDGRRTVPESAKRRIEAEQAHRALAWLEEASSFHPDSPALFIERASICFNCLHDPLAAAQEYRRAAGLPGAPRYAARLHAEMLRRAGRKPEALAWLVALHPRLPRGDEAAAADVVLGRIRDLEAELGLPPEQCYRVQEF